MLLESSDVGSDLTANQIRSEAVIHIDVIDTPLSIPTELHLPYRFHSTTASSPSYGMSEFSGGALRMSLEEQRRTKPFSQWTGFNLAVCSNGTVTNFRKINHLFHWL